MNLPIGNVNETRHSILLKLNFKQRVILDYVCEGLSNKDIGDKMGIQDKGVKYHLTNMYKLLQVSGRIEAAFKYRDYIKKVLK
jgi:two-component system nitrate/nitrite response regulator NarL